MIHPIGPSRTQMTALPTAWSFGFPYRITNQEIDADPKKIEDRAMKMREPIIGPWTGLRKRALSAAKDALSVRYASLGLTGKAILGVT